MANGKVQSEAFGRNTAGKGRPSLMDRFLPKFLASQFRRSLGNRRETAPSRCASCYSAGFLPSLRPHTK